jgi:hypothetical protein
MIDILTLREAKRIGGAGKAARTYLDFYIAGTRLLDLLGGGLNADAITPLGWGTVESQERSIAELLLRETPVLRTWRCMLYVCAECGDISCGAVTVRVEREAGCFVWREFGYEHDWDEDLHLSKFATVGPFHFKEDSYLQVLGSVRPREIEEA